VRYSSKAVFFSTIGCAGFLCAGLLSGCGREEVKSYRVPKAETSRAAHFHDGHECTADHHNHVPVLEWKTPDGWEQVAPGQMRVASFRIKGEGQTAADVGVFPLPGMAGSDLDNVNRWRGQVGLEAVSDEGLAALAESVEVGGGKAHLYDLAGENVAAGEKMRILGVIARRDGVAWFFKMTGDDDLVAGQKPAFRDFLGSVKFNPGGTMPVSHPPIDGMAGLPPSHPPIDGMGLPPSHPAIDGMMLPVSHPQVGGMSPGNAGSGEAGVEGGGSKLGLKAPEGWVEVPAGQFLVAKYLLKGAGAAEAAVNVSTSAGDGGGVVGNVNRWRGQLGLAALPADKLDLKKIEVGGVEAALVDLRAPGNSPEANTQVVGIVASRGEQTWFYKLMGDSAVVERERDAFVQFVKGANAK
jgi:hypothetical protein